MEPSNKSKKLPKAKINSELQFGKNAASEQMLLVTRFFESNSRKDNGLYASMALDLYRAITCYRYYDSLQEFLDTNPELDEHKQDIVELWQEFDTLSSQELAEISLKLLEDL